MGLKWVTKCLTYVINKFKYILPDISDANIHCGGVRLVSFILTGWKTDFGGI